MASRGQNPTKCELCTYAYHFIGFRCWGIQIWDPLFNMFGLKSLDILLDLQTVTSRGQNQKYSFSLLMYIKLQVFLWAFQCHPLFKICDLKQPGPLLGFKVFKFFCKQLQMFCMFMKVSIHINKFTLKTNYYNQG